MVEIQRTMEESDAGHVYVVAANAAANAVKAASANAAADAKVRTKMQAKLCGIIRNRLKIGMTRATTSHIGFLKSLNACGDGIAWARNYDSLDKAWDACERPEHLLWLCGRMADKPGWPTRKDIVLAACDCAEQVLHLVKPGEDRPRKAIEAARTWVRGEIGIDEVRAYAHAANDAYAAYAAPSTAESAYAASAAADAAYAADAAASNH
jgi:hypothetical protein